MERDDEIRSRCFLALDALRARHGDDLPYAGGLDAGFNYHGRRVPFLNRQKGIYRAAAQRGPAALAMQTSFRAPYADEATDEGLRYAYRAGDIDQPDNRALRYAYVLEVPLVYFSATRPGWYRAEYPMFVQADEPAARSVLIAPGRMIGPLDEPQVVSIPSAVERMYALREVRSRLHQGRFRAMVMQAYRDRCTICRLREVRLLDAAHIVQDVAPGGAAEISNGLSLCSIHHRAYDQDLLGISPEYQVHLARRLLDEDDGPMLDVLKHAEGRRIDLPRKSLWRPDRERLASRFERFAAG